MREKKANMHEISTEWVCEIDGKLTFCGALREFYDECAKNWAPATQSQYNRDYNEKILPNLHNHDTMPIIEYTREDYDAAIQAIADKGQERKGGQTVQYADSTLQHYRHLICVVVVTASKHEKCDNVLWGSVFALAEKRNTTDEVNERVTLKKSLTLAEEAKIYKALMTDEKQRGQDMGLLLMFALGLRNNEACGANYGDIRPMQSHPECKALWVYKSTIIGSNVVKAGGKTRNADRIIPMPAKLEAYIAKRLEHLGKEVSFSQSDEIQSISDLPIACLGNDYSERCSAGQLTAAGREMFRKIKLSQRQLAYIDAELQTPTEERALEKDPTAYLLRRNFGTHLHILGLTEPEIEYTIGHDITDAYESRNEFVNEEKLYDIKLKLDQRPLLNDVNEMPETQIVQLEPNKSYPLGSQRQQTLRVGLRQGCLKIQLTTNEPQDKMEIRLAVVPQKAVIHRKIFVTAVPPNYTRSIDILEKYHKRYARYQDTEKP